jgi:hypothetical protein
MIDTMNVTTLKVKPIPRDKPGHLLRERRYMQIAQRLQTGDPAAIDEWIKFLVTEHEIEAPEGVNVTETILNLSRDEFEGLVKAVNASKGVDPTSAA